MGLPGEQVVISGTEKLTAVFFKKRRARLRTRAHLGRMRDIVDGALDKGRWPSGAPVAQWEKEWDKNGDLLTSQMSAGDVDALEDVYGRVLEFKRGLDAGPREFGATNGNPDEDRDFFERYRSAVQRGSVALETSRERRARSRQASTDSIG
jgi:hypothetical protein